MRFLLLVLVLVVTGCAGCASVPKAASAQQLRGMALRLEFRGPGGAWSICGGTAVAADAIDTATHCTGLALSTINGKPASAVRSQKLSDDRVRIWVTGVTFERWAADGQKPQAGDRVRWWGNPQGVPFVYREGRVVAVETGGIVVDATICKGDSGSGLFNDEGSMVGVVSAMNNTEGCTFMVAR